ncbi:hypothetical protein ACUHMQ_00430 [Chitinimonas sp. PSY-7]|uniref:hypothetical protein n=1 Tax=Chitinimonas sp. PSY-7 TaxID=3459088 RepID=UPI0040402020
MQKEGLYYRKPNEEANQRNGWPPGCVVWAAEVHRQLGLDRPETITALDQDFRPSPRRRYVPYYALLGLRVS